MNGFKLIRYLRKGQDQSIDISIDKLNQESIDVEVRMRILSGNDRVTTKGFCWSTEEDFVLSDAEGVKSINSKNPEFSKTIVDMLPGTLYYIKAFAEDKDGKVFYSETIKNQTDYVILKEQKSFYLTYSGSPHTNIDIMFVAHTEEYIQNEPSKEIAKRDVYFRKKGDTEWIEYMSSIDRFPHTSSEYQWEELYVNRVKIDGLIPNTQYEFRIGDGDIESFWTIKDSDFNTEPLKVAYIGDIQSKPNPKKGSVMQDREPDFIVLGGDNAADNNDPSEERYPKWDKLMWSGFFTYLRRNSDGSVIPVVPQVGNHEVTSGGTSESLDDVATHFAAFPYHREAGGYFNLEISDLLDIYILNSEYGAPYITGTDKQTTWFINTLNKNRHFKHKTVSHHVPTRRSVRAYNPTSPTVRVKQHWEPIYIENGVKLVMEGHEHAYHRSEIIDGVQYFLNTWGIGPTNPRNYRTLDWAERTYGGIYVQGDEPHPTDGQSANPVRGHSSTFVEYYPTKFRVSSIDEENEEFYVREENI